MPPFLSFATYLARQHQLAIDWIIRQTGSSDRLLHAHAGMAIFVLTSLIARRPLASPIPFAAVCVAELINETLDRVSTGSWMMRDTTIDAVNTLFWPLVVMLVLRMRRRGQSRTAAGR